MNPACDLIVRWLARLPTAAHAGTIAPDTELIDQGILDSIAILDLVGFLEQNFGIVFPLEDFVPENFRTAAAIAALALRLGGKGT